MERLVRIASRASELALWQSKHVAALLAELNPRLRIEILPITTHGDRILDRPLRAVGGKGLFIKELEVALKENRADIAVHSMKDVPAEIPGGLHIPAILVREDPRDVLLTNKGATLDEIPEMSRIGTSSLRRRGQILSRRDDLILCDLRGNVPTRIEKLETGMFDAIVLAAAGLRRLGLLRENYQFLGLEVMLPAIGQGAIGIECRQEDESIGELLDPLNDAATSFCVGAERAMNLILGGDCHAPVAGHAYIQGNDLTIAGLVSDVDGMRSVRSTANGAIVDAEQIGKQLGEALLENGAGEILMQNGR